MSVYNSAMIAKRVVAAVLIATAIAATGCRPSSANIALRKENQALEGRVAQLERELQGARAKRRTVADPSTQPQVSEDLIQRLYTAHGLRFGRSTGSVRAEGADGKPDIAVHVVPTDEDNQTLKAAGKFAITVYDFSSEERPLIGKKEFSLEEAREAWHGQAFLFNYVLRVPLEREPKSEEVLIRVEFTDELTGRIVEAEHKARVRKG